MTLGDGRGGGQAAPVASAVTPSFPPPWARAALLLLVATTACSLYRSVIPAAPPVGVDLNRASRERIADLPGLEPSDADRIIENRPYDTKDAVLRRGIVTREQFDAIAGRIYVGRSAGRTRD